MSKDCTLVKWATNRIWYCDMPYRVAGAPMGHRMTIIRLDNNKLFIHSPIEITATLQQQLSQLGEIAYVVTPNKSHNIYLSDWWLAYPQAYFYAPPGLIHKRSDLTFDGALGNHTPSHWQGQLLQTVIRGSDSMEEIAFCDPQSKTLIVGDALAWMVDSHHPLTFALSVINGCYFKPAMPLYWRITFRNHTQLRQSIQEILTWPFERIILSHGRVIDNNAKAYFSAAFQWVMPHKLKITTIQ
ncbi:DUF4336 domain-containing protein [uncultured Photobacterium sp.]|uniref:DUF4336 domain-containing protein n=1 Tax=uncultured Photobacterium sp. TaxID=173973 RepID=UPI0026358859|nr:DUF4336 domain-containing protein [uncultured Photobacterium sp.]